MRMIVTITLVALTAALPARAAAVDRGTADRVRYLMGTTCRIAACHPAPGAAGAAIEEAFAEIARWESILSDWVDTSELSRLNAAAGRGAVPCSADLFAFLLEAGRFVERTGGAFDPSGGALVDIYDLRGNGRWPSSGEVSATLLRAGWRRVTLNEESRTVHLDAVGLRLDPGAIGKGWALDAAAARLRRSGVLWALLNFGGQVLAIGSGPDRNGFQVEVPVGSRASKRKASLRLIDASVSTSANDERGLIVDGTPLGHILDMRTGLPVTGMASVTVMAPSATIADVWSTALFVLGPRDGVASAARAGVEALFTLQAQESPDIVMTPGFRRMLSPDPAGETSASPVLFPALTQGER